ncbi:protein translocase subunit SecF [Alginatibacterium sediminis]|nr:protein translocase subunit SecF [Alginatibacterium sediminis]
MQNFNRLTQVRSLMSLVSVALLLASLFFMIERGYNWGLDFTGGVVADILLDPNLEQTDIKAHLESDLGHEVQILSMQGDGKWQLRYGVQDNDSIAALNDSVALLSSEFQILNSSVIGPQVGQDMIEQGSLAILLCFVLTMIYLSYRFEWRLALGSIIALSYDILLVLGLFACLQLEFNLTVLAALLAVMGYSLNDSIIISDRIREVLRSQPNGDIDTLLDQSIASTISRTIVTSGTTLVTVSALWLLGGPALEGFAIALCLGIASGTWSSISIGTVLPKMMGLQAQHYQVVDDKDPIDAMP